MNKLQRLVPALPLESSDHFWQTVLLPRENGASSTTTIDLPWGAMINNEMLQKKKKVKEVDRVGGWVGGDRETAHGEGRGIRLNLFLRDEPGGCLFLIEGTRWGM